jgi:glycosyltransferase involved in cell wall biosynthesis
MTTRPAVSVIIPTACVPARVAALRRAIASVLDQQRVACELIVVVNGPNFDGPMLGELRANPELRVEYLEAANLPAAHRHGRACVTSPFFAFIDDDDEFLPGALHTRVSAMLEDESIDVVATNGVWGHDRSTPYIRSTRGIEEDPLAALFRGNWLGSAGGLFRTATVTPDFFDGETRFFEWTMIAYRLTRAGLRVRFLDVPTYVMNETPQSLSRCDAYLHAEPLFLRALLTHDLPAEVLQQIRNKYHGALHTLADRYRDTDPAKAWKYHLLSLRGIAGLRYLPFTRKLLRPALRTALGRRSASGRRRTGKDALA